MVSVSQEWETVISILFRMIWKLAIFWWPNTEAVVLWRPIIMNVKSDKWWCELLQATYWSRCLRGSSGATRRTSCRRRAVTARRGSLPRSWKKGVPAKVPVPNDQMRQPLAATTCRIPEHLFTHTHPAMHARPSSTCKSSYTINKLCISKRNFEVTK